MGDNDRDNVDDHTKLCHNRSTAAEIWCYINFSILNLLDRYWDQQATVLVGRYHCAKYG